MHCWHPILPRPVLAPADDSTSEHGEELTQNAWETRQGHGTRKAMQPTELSYRKQNQGTAASMKRQGKELRKSSMQKEGKQKRFCNKGREECKGTCCIGMAICGVIMMRFPLLGCDVPWQLPMLLQPSCPQCLRYPDLLSYR